MFDGFPQLQRGELRRRSDRRWRAEVDAVIGRFCAAFPDIIYDVAWDVRALNGVAYREVTQRHVRLYGGLVRHRMIGIEAVVLLLAHETGHHLGGEPRDEIDKWMSCERQADRWAAEQGVAMAWRGDRKEAARIVRKGARQLLAFERCVLRNDNYWLARDADGKPDHASPLLRYRGFLSALRENDNDRTGDLQTIDLGAVS